MVANMTPELEFQIQKARRRINQATLEDAREIAGDMYQAWLKQNIVLNQASRYIAELECREAISQPAKPRRDLGRLLRQVIRWFMPQRRRLQFAPIQSSARLKRVK